MIWRVVQSVLILPGTAVVIVPAILQWAVAGQALTGTQASM